MKDYLRYDEWKIWEDNFHPEYNEVTESIMSLGNGKFGTRGNFEERFSGQRLQGSYVGGVWFPDKTRVGWWKNGYPDYFAKVINSINWIGIDVEIDGETLDLAQVEIKEFHRELDLKKGILSKNIVLETAEKKVLRIQSRRFCSTHDSRFAQVHYAVSAENFSARVALISTLDGDVRNRDSNHDEHFWEEVHLHPEGYIQMRTKPNPFGVPRFDVGVAVRHAAVGNGEILPYQPEVLPSRLNHRFETELRMGQRLTLEKTVAILNTNDFSAEALASACKAALAQVPENLEEKQATAWAKAWENADIVIEGDVSAQVGIRFNIFHLLQTYNGEDSRLNIGPKGFTGEKYGGVTYWDTEAYCIPFYLASSDFSVARNLLIYRHNHLQKAIDNAAKLGFKDGAALYPMVTMNGEECHNEWEITFEEIHRNGAIAYAIMDYIRYTGDQDYMEKYGLDVLVGISRFWSQRVHWSEQKKAYVMLGVTGPNEYENNVNNNWYTNYMAVWTLKYTLENLNKYPRPEVLAETERWQHIIQHMYFPYDDERQVFLQQDGFLDKELLHVDQITAHRPINQKWSWDRILRSCFIKQADVLQGMYFFEEDFDLQALERNYLFYEPMTVHESSLSPCVHAILACKLGMTEKAYEMYLRTSRLDLDDYNNDTEDGLHITSMAGTWLAVVKGFAGVRVAGNDIQVHPHLPAQWKSLRFRLRTVDGVKEIKIEGDRYEIKDLQ